jgi:intein/homing endonuclease
LEINTPCFDGARVTEKQIRAVYRHKVSKKKWKLTASNGKTVIMTEDHSAMVLRDGKLTEVKPTEIIKSDKLIGIKHANT